MAKLVIAAICPKCNGILETIETPWKFERSPTGIHVKCLRPNRESFLCKACHTIISVEKGEIVSTSTRPPRPSPQSPRQAKRGSEQSCKQRTPEQQKPIDPNPGRFKNLNGGES